MNNKIIIYWFVFVLVLFVYLLGMLNIPLMDVDSSQYAHISREMAKSGEYLQVKCSNLNYLDKPPLLFWLSAFFFKIFGASHFVFRLPALLFTLLGVWSTYQLAKLLYNKRTAAISAVMLVSTQAFFLIHHDLRTDTLLADTAIFAIWQLTLFIRNNKLHNLLLGSLGVALAMLAKGPIGLMLPVIAFSAEFMLKKQWGNFFRWQWLLSLLIIAICLAPMTWGLYKQFGVQGVKFYYWTQSFGRITGESEWKNDAGPFFLSHSFLWSFLPWTLFALGGIGLLLKNIFFSDSNNKPKEYILLGGFLLTFIALSSSHYQLPHYVFVLYPLAAIIAAQYLDHVVESNMQIAYKVLFYFQCFLMLLLAAGILMICLWVFPERSILNWGFLFLLFCMIAFTFVRIKEKELRMLLPSVLMIIAANYVLNTNFYPNILQYQSGTGAAAYFRNNQAPKDRLAFILQGSAAMHFYSDTTVKNIGITEIDSLLINSRHPLWIYTNQTGREAVIRETINHVYTISKTDSFIDFPVTQLNFEFLDPNKRASVTRKNYILTLEKK